MACFRRKRVSCTDRAQPRFLAACCKQKLGIFLLGEHRPPFGHDKLTRMPAASNNSKCMSIDVLAGRLLWVMIALALFGCASSPQVDAGQSPRAHRLADNVPTRAGGEPANAPKRPNAPLAYPPVFEVEQVPRAKLLNDEEYKKLWDDLVAARERVLARAKATTSAQAENKNNAVAAGRPAAGEQLTASASN